MDYVSGIAYLMIILSVLVIVHEWGHFAAAKFFKMRVEEFALFFGPILARLGKRGDTEYNLRSIPLGGFVRIAGMEPDDISGGRPILECIRNPQFAKEGGDMEQVIRQLDSDTMAGIDADNISVEVRQTIRDAVAPNGLLTEDGRRNLEDLTRSPRISTDAHKLIDIVLNADKRARDLALYSQKPLYQRALVIFAGPFMSMFFAFFLFSIMGVTFGLPSDKITNQVQVSPDGRARQAGLQTGDRIVAINGLRTPDGKALVDKIHGSVNVPLNLTIGRDDRTFNVTVTPAPFEMQKYDNDKPVFKDGKPVKETVGVIGVIPNPVFERLGPWESLVAGTRITKLYVVGLVTTVFSRDAPKAVGGPIAMGQMTTAVQRLGMADLVMLAAMISLSLGIMNLLPIPILDGGHLLLLAIEKIRRRRLSPREVWRAQMVGLSLLALMVGLVMYNDIVKTITHHSFQ